VTTLAPYVLAALGAAVTYVVWAYSRVFADRPVIAAVAALVAMLAGAALWLATLTLVVRLL
jgi:hypothetical protein